MLKLILSFVSQDLTARLAQSVEHETLNLRVVGSSPTLGANFLTPTNASVYFILQFCTHG